MTGRIEVQSSPGAGTRFDIVLPLQKTAAVVAA
jgi:chemotaxis protein histidine kinase CheA